MDNIRKINAYVENVNRNDSLASLLENVMTQQLTEESTPRNYYYLTDLINPTQAYFKKLYPAVRKPPDLARRLARGIMLHNLACAWFRSYPDFVVEEALVDGIYAGVPRVRGKIDIRAGRSIYELKTKDNTPETVEEIVSLYPQDLEQLAFYSVIHPSEPRVNYLVFMRNSSPFNMKAFSVEITDANRIKDILRSRIRKLDEAIENEDPSQLGKCRYYESGCEFRSSNECSCDALEPINIDAILNSLNINFDEEVTTTLEECRDTSSSLSASLLTTINIIAPRKHYMEVIRGLETPYRGDQRDEYKACLWASVNILKNQRDMDLSIPERQSVVESQLEPRINIGFRWLKLFSSSHLEGQITPYLLSVSFSRYPNYPSSYHLAELGIVCATYDKSRGLIFAVYPELNKLVRVFEVTYRNIAQIRRIVRETIDKVEESEQSEDLLSLPECPNWMNDDGNCPLYQECHSQRGSGCT